MVSVMANPSRRNSGFQASSTVGASAATRAASRSAVPAGTVDLPDQQAGSGQQRQQAVDRRIHGAEVGGVLAVLLRRADAEELHIGEGRHLGVRRGEPQSTRCLLYTSPSPRDS